MTTVHEVTVERKESTERGVLPPGGAPFTDDEIRQRLEEALACGFAGRLYNLDRHCGSYLIASDSGDLSLTLIGRVITLTHIEQGENSFVGCTAEIAGGTLSFFLERQGLTLSDGSLVLFEKNGSGVFQILPK